MDKEMDSWMKDFETTTTKTGEESSTVKVEQVSENDENDDKEEYYSELTRKQKNQRKGT